MLRRALQSQHLSATCIYSFQGLPNSSNTPFSGSEDCIGGGLARVAISMRLGIEGKADFRGYRT
jgi:hypothetical protein